MIEFPDMYFPPLNLWNYPNWRLKGTGEIRVSGRSLGKSERLRKLRELEDAKTKILKDR